MPLISINEISVEALMADLPMQRAKRSQLEMQLVTLKEGLAVDYNPLEWRNPLKRHTVGDFETLQTVSVRLFGKPDHWKDLARVNNLSYPYTIYPGQQLVIPEVAAHG